MIPGALAVSASIVAVVLVGRVLRAIASTVRDVRAAAWADGVAHRDTFANPLAPGVAVVVPAESARDVADTVAAAQNARYPDVRVVVVDSTDDGSATAVTRAAIDVGPARSVPAGVPGPDDVVESPDSSVAIARSDAGWAGAARGVELARRELVAIVPPGTFLDSDALLWAATAFIDDAAVTAVRGAVLPVDAHAVERGRIVHPPLPRHPIRLLQVPSRLREAARASGPGATARSFVVVRTDVVGPRDANVPDPTSGLAHGARRGTDQARAERERIPAAVAWTVPPRSLAGLLAATVRSRSDRVATLRAFGVRGGVVGAVAAHVLVPLAGFAALVLAPVAVGSGAVGLLPVLAGAAVAWSLAVLASLVVVGGEIIGLRRYGGAGPTLLLALAALLAPVLIDPVEAAGRLLGTLAGLGRRVRRVSPRSTRRR